MPRSVTAATLVVLASLAPASADAQTSSPPTVQGRREARVPSLTVSLGAGQISGLPQSLLIVSVQVPIGDYLLIEGEAARWSFQWRWINALGDCAGSSPGDCVPLAGGVFAGIAGGAAAVMGALADAASAERNLLNLAPGPPSSTSVVPMLTARSVGAALAYRW